MSNKKVLKFPEFKGEATFPTSIQESLEHVEEVRKQYCEEISSDVFDAALTVINNYGLTVKANEIFIKDAVFLEEAIKAFVYRFKRLHHPLHEIIEQTITISDELQSEIHEKIDENLKTH
jgi:uncharacterized protein YllA (UPF0747 family)